MQSRIAHASHVVQSGGNWVVTLHIIHKRTGTCLSPTWEYTHTVEYMSQYTSPQSSVGVMLSNQPMFTRFRLLIGTKVGLYMQVMLFSRGPNWVVTLHIGTCLSPTWEYTHTVEYMSQYTSPQSSVGVMLSNQPMFTRFRLLIGTKIKHAKSDCTCKSCCSVGGQIELWHCTSYTNVQVRVLVPHENTRTL